MHDDFGVGLAFEHIAFCLQRGAQFVMVFNDAVVDQRHLARTVFTAGAGAVAEVRVGVMHGRNAVGGPAGVGNAGAAFHMLGADLLLQFGHARCAARPLQAVGINRHAAGVITPILQPLQALNQDGNNISAGNRCNDAAHKKHSLKNS